MVLHPMSQGQIPQVSASAEDQESSGGHAGMLSQELAGKKTFSASRRNTAACTACSGF